MERLKIIGAFICDCAFIVLIALFVWAFCKVTPDQLSGEADWSAKACVDAGVEYAPAFGKGVR